MNDLKEKIQRQLIANVIKEKCIQNSRIIFKESLCTQERVIRFTTEFFKEMIKDKNVLGKWNTNDLVMYELYNDSNLFYIECVLDLKNSNIELGKEFAKKLNLNISRTQNEIVLKSWKIENTDKDLNKFIEKFETFLNKDINVFENILKQNEKIEDKDEEAFIEGLQEKMFSTKYERNAKARKKCLEVHGTACAVCGIDFGKVYGPEFAGKIEVHHIVPISQIGKEYVVDPVKDLIPLCPNCHTAIHSKKDGAYTVEELKKQTKIKK